MAGLLDPRDFTSQYNTQLDQDQESNFKSWATQNNKLGDLYDYDLRGAFKAGVGTDPNGHMTDLYKKPNHPTFSTNSQYHGVDGYVGGQWMPGTNGTWGYQPSPQHLQMWNPEELQDYFSRVEPKNRLILPGLLSQ